MNDHLLFESLDYLEVRGEDDCERNDEAKHVDEEDVGHVDLLVLSYAIPLHATATKM